VNRTVEQGHREGVVLGDGLRVRSGRGRSLFEWFGGKWKGVVPCKVDSRARPRLAELRVVIEVRWVGTIFG